MILYLLELMHLLIHYINLRKDFFDGIKSNYTYFNYKRPKHQANIAQIVVYYKIVKTELCANNEICNNKNYVI